MTSRKRNEFLEADSGDEENESQGYRSDDNDFKKGRRSPKRRKVEHSDASDEESEGEASADQQQPQTEPKDLSPSAKSSTLPTEHPNPELPGISKALSKKNLIATAAAIKRSGVVYLSRIPPFMKPHKLRSLLSPHGDINRIFLAPEATASHALRVRHAGNKKRSYVEGWVEFRNKAEAKKTCELLNAGPMGGKKGSYYRDDVWNLVYLKGFKWAHLTEQIAAENAQRASRMRAEMGKMKRENNEFVRNVERAKMLEGMEAKRANKRKAKGGRVGDATAMVQVVKKGAERSRSFKQTAVASKMTAEDRSEQVTRVLSKIF